MRIHPILPAAVAALITLAPAGARAESRWSSSVHTGLAFTNVGVGTGATIDLLHGVQKGWSLGAEAGYAILPGVETGWAYPAFIPAPEVTGGEIQVVNASGVVRARTGGSVRVHGLGTVGCYRVTTRRTYSQGQDSFHEQYPGFGFGLGVSGSGPLRPGFRLRWDQVLRTKTVLEWDESLGNTKSVTRPDYLDVVTFAVGLHFN